MANRPRTSLRARLIEWVLWKVNVKKNFMRTDGLRERILKSRPKNAAPPRSIRRKYQVGETSIDGRPVYSLSRRASATSDRVLFLHGGAYVYEIMGLQWKLLAKLLERIDVEFVVPLYPLAPENTATETVAFVRAVYEAMGMIDAPPAGFLGDSSGGGMAVALAQVLSTRGYQLPNCLALLSPWLDVSCSDPRQFNLEKLDPILSAPALQQDGIWYAGRLSTKDPLVSPLYGDLHKLPTTLILTGTHDLLHTVRDAIAEVNRTLGITIALVVVVIFAFLRLGSATLIAAATIPVSVCGSFIAMRLLGYSIDMFSMLGITLSIGFIVDDAIVVIENVVRHREMGKARAMAASDGAAEVAFTVVSMTVSLVAVFLPILFLNGVLGRLLREFAVAISVSILLSGFTALTLTPMLASRFLRTSETAQAHFGLWLEGLYQRLERAYSTSLNVVLRHARLTLLLTAGMAAATVFLFAAIPKSFAPQVDTGAFSGSLVAADSSSMARMIAYGEQVNAMMARLGSMRSNLAGVEGPNTAWIHVNLTDDPHRPEVGVVMADLQRQTDRIPGLKVYLRRDPFLRLSGDEGRSQYAATLEGPNEEELYRWAPKLKDALSALPQLANVSSDLELSAPRLNVAIRRDLATSLGIDPGRIANTLYDAYGSRTAGTVTVASRRYDILLDVADRFQSDPEALQSLSVRSSSGRLVPLGTLTEQTEAVAPLTVNHSGQFPAVTFQFDLRRGTSLDAAARLIREASARTGMPATLSFAFRGTAAQFQSSLEGLGVLLLIAVTVIYLVLGMLYESFIHPVTILSGLPPAAIGALLALLLTGQDLNLYSFLGILLLVGIAKKNAIMIVDFALHAQRAERLDPAAAAYRGCLQRFRPITMTTAAALLGSVPVALAGGVGGEVRRPLGIAVVGGLLLSQLLTLYVTPVLYTSFSGLQRRITPLPASVQNAALVQPLD